MMDSLCPPESSYIRRRLCAILVTDDKDDDNEARQQLRQFTRQFKFSRDRIALSYIYSEKQIEFLRTLVEGFVYIKCILVYMKLLFFSFRREISK